MDPSKIELHLLEEGVEQIISERNQRHFRHRIIRCSLCNVATEFDELPHQCSTPDCENMFQSGQDILIPDDFFWSDQRLRNAKVLIVGCGAVGNEVVKNLALAGVMNFTLIDFDTVEESNRSRAILFQEASMAKAKETTGEQFKVDVMAAALKQIDAKINVTCIKEGIPDNASLERNRQIELGNKQGEIRRLLSEVKLASLCTEHDLAVIGTDGWAAAAKFNRIAYPFLPQVRGGMNEHGTLSYLALTLPYITYCLECADLNNTFGFAVRPPEDEKQYPKPQGVFDWNRWEQVTGISPQESEESKAKRACFAVAEAAGAQSFAHANSVIGAAMSAQALLILHGYPLIVENEGRWPSRVPKPLINHTLKLSTFMPHKTELRRLYSGSYPDGNMHCGACNFLSYGANIGNMFEAYKTAGFDAIENTPRFNPDAAFWKEKEAPPPPPRTKKEK